MPGGVWRTWEYDHFGRLLMEKLDGLGVRILTYDDANASISEITYPIPDPARTTVRSVRIDGTYEPTPDPMRFTARRLEARMHLPDMVAMTADPAKPLDTGWPPASK